MLSAKNWMSSTSFFLNEQQKIREADFFKSAPLFIFYLKSLIFGGKADTSINEISQFFST